MSNFLVSIIIPVYNVERYIRECLDSVLNQTYTNIEVICVDDASTDDSLSILREYCSQDNRIKVIENSCNMGPAYTRNVGFNEVKGKYTYYLDSDDYIELNAIEILCAYAEKYGTECIYFNSKYLIEKEGLGGPCLNYGLKDVYGKIYDGPTIFKILVKNKVYVNALWKSFWRTDFLIDNDIKFVDGLFAEDALFCTKAILSENRVMVIEESLHTYRRGEGTLSTIDSPSKMVSIFKNYCILLDFWRAHQFLDDVNEVIDEYLENMLITAKRLYLKTKDVISKNDFSDSVERHLFEVLINQEYDRSLDNIDPGILKKLLNTQKIIVYGAGRYAAEVIEKLKRKSIHVDSLAVTQMHVNVKSIDEIPVYEIKDLVYLKEDAIVVLGVGKRNRQDVIKVLNMYGFRNYISLEG